MSEGADRLAEVKGRIDAAARAAGRAPADTTLVAVSKTHGADRVRELLAVGQRVFGDDRALGSGVPILRINEQRAGDQRLEA